MTVTPLRLALVSLPPRGAPRAADAPPLRVSMIPTTDPSKMLRDSEPLVTRLEKATGRKVKLTIPQNYAAVVEAMVQGQLDLAHFGGFTFVQANKRAGAVPLVQRERDRAFHSKLITARDDVKTLADLKGKRFAFGDVNSTSGHLMPAYFMRKEGVDPAVLDGAIYTGGHDATALAVAEKRVDAGALDEAVWDRLVKEGKVDATQGPRLLDHPGLRRLPLGGAEGPRAGDPEEGGRGLPHPRPGQRRGQEGARSPRAPTAKYVAVDVAAYAPLRDAAIREGLLK